MCVKRQWQLDRQRNRHQVIKSQQANTHTHTHIRGTVTYIYCCCHTFVLFHTWCWYTHVISCTLSLTFRLWTHAIPAQAFSEIMHPHFLSSAAQEWLLSVWKSCLKDGCMQQCRFTMILVMLWFCSLNKCKFVSINLWKLQYAWQFNAGSVDANAYLGEVQTFFIIF